MGGLEEMNMETPDPAAHSEHVHEPPLQAYLAVFVALSVFTVVSFIANWAARNDHITHTTSFTIILGVAVVKACLVAIIFMHLKWDWRRLYFMIAPAFILAPFLVLALLPDIVLYWKNLAGK
jgi:cytochrome c oxidase subunit IV